MARYRNLAPLPWLIAFEAAARHKSFGLAAKALGTSQPAISQRIANLESMVAVSLFKRLPRGVDLTPQGDALLAGLSEGLSQIAQAIEETRQSTLRNLTVATDFGFAAFWLIPRLPSLQQVLPEVNVRVVTSQGSLDVRRDPADVAVIFGSSHWPGCTAELLMPETVLPVCSPSFLSAHPVLRTLADLQNVPLLHLESVADARWLDWSGWFRACSVSCTLGKNRISINNYSLVIQAALAGQGAALGWRPLINDFMARGQLVAAIDRTVETKSGYYVVHRQTSANGRTVDRFCAWLRTQMNDAPEPMDGGLRAEL
ncbi:choline sulfate utilization transcriptional regulator [Methylobacterium sp. E-066]|uniref:choline sulfate utilization transcriptional regulator n=1 Tax=Methylobacterium sp. E-066 TaxID=2836584 RepID=UPI001FB8C92A|nr:LysR substrate-binding domain-containing protein [Methylobacterium sp. E-066]MCJ2142412.1 LysR substrate-binding domain-containing protein [Methylobacterium sp. E-066]